MSRATLRAAVVNFLEDQTTIAAVYSSFPKVLDPAAYFAQNVPTGCAAVVHLTSEHEHRLSLGGPHSGVKRLDTTVDVHLFSQSKQPKAEDAMDDFDALVESLKERIRADRELGTGTGGAVWQAGEDMSGRYSEPVTVGQVTQIWAVISFTATEMLVGT